jgi:hypothetical protein
MAIRMSGNTERRVPKTLTWPLLVVGILGLLFALWLVGREAQLRWHAVRELPGQVVGYESKQSSCGGGKRRSSRPCTKYRVLLAATGKDAGIPVEAHSFWSTHRHWNVGESVTLLLQPDGQAWFCTWHDFIPGGIATLLGGLFLGVGFAGSRRGA